MSTILKRTLSFVLCLLMIVTATVVAVPVGAINANAWQQNPGGNVIYLEHGQTYAYRANILTSFRVLQLMTVGAGGSCVLNLYRWDTDYETTIQTPPINTLTVDAVADNTLHSLYNVASSETDKFLDPDEYLVTIQNTTDASDTTSRLGVQGKNNGEAAAGFYYLDGVEKKDHDAKLHLFVTSAADSVYGTCEPSQSTETFKYPAGTEYAPDGASAGGEAKYFTSSSSVAYRMNFATSVRNLHVQIVTVDTKPNVTLTLYKWNRNYAATVAGTALASSTYTSISNNAYQNVGDADKVWEAGEYLIVLTTDNADGTTLKVGHQGKTLGESAGYYYVDGVEQPKGYAMRVEFYVCEATNEFFGPTAPETYTYAADYMYHPDAAASANNAKWLPAEQAVAYRFALATDVDALQVQLVTVGTPDATLKLYQWDGTYASTVSGTPILENTLTTVANGTWYYIGEQTDVVKAGQYLLVISSTNADGTSIRLGHQGKDKGDAAVGYYYVNGVKQDTDHDMRIWFDVVKASDALFASLYTDDIIYRGVQASTDIKTADQFNIRFAATIDTLDYQNVGFEVTAVVAGQENRTWTSKTKNVYASLNAKSSDNKELKAVTAEELGGEYIVAMTIKNVPADTAIQFVVKPYVIGLDGTKEYGKTWNVNVTVEGEVSHVKA